MNGNSIENSCLAGGFNPVAKYARQLGWFPRFRGEDKKIFEVSPPFDAGDDPEFPETDNFWKDPSEQPSFENLWGVTP